MADKVKGVEIDQVREELARLLEDALDYSRMCRDIKRIVGGEEENPFKTAVDYLVSNGVTVQELDGCEHCRIASYTENPFTVITQMGREVKTQFNFCPNCGRRLNQPPKGE